MDEVSRRREQTDACNGLAAALLEVGKHVNDGKALVVGHDAGTDLKVATDLGGHFDGFGRDGVGAVSALARQDDIGNPKVHENHRRCG